MDRTQRSKSIRRRAFRIKLTPSIPMHREARGATRLAPPRTSIIISGKRGRARARSRTCRVANSAAVDRSVVTVRGERCNHRIWCTYRHRCVRSPLTRLRARVSVGPSVRLRVCTSARQTKDDKRRGRAGGRLQLVKSDCRCERAESSSQRPQLYTQTADLSATALEQRRSRFTNNWTIVRLV